MDKPRLVELKADENYTFRFVGTEDDVAVDVYVSFADGLLELLNVKVTVGYKSLEDYEEVIVDYAGVESNILRKGLSLSYRRVADNIDYDEDIEVHDEELADRYINAILDQLEYCFKEKNGDVVFKYDVFRDYLIMCLRDLKRKIGDKIYEMP